MLQAGELEKVEVILPPPARLDAGTAEGALPQSTQKALGRLFSACGLSADFTGGPTHHTYLARSSGHVGESAYHTRCRGGQADAVVSAAVWRRVVIGGVESAQQGDILTQVAGSRTEP